MKPKFVFIFALISLLAQGSSFLPPQPGIVVSGGEAVVNVPLVTNGGITSDNPIAIETTGNTGQVNVATDGRVTLGTVANGSLTVNGLCTHARSGSNTWLNGPSGSTYILSNNTSGATADVAVLPVDADGTDIASVTVVGRSQGADTESARFRYDPAGFTEIASVASGAGTIRPLRFYTGGNTTQMVLNTDNTVSIRNTTFSGNGTNQINIRHNVTTAGTNFWSFFGNPGDTTTSVTNRVCGLGIDASSPNRECLNMGWNVSTSTYRVQTVNSNAGILRPIELLVGTTNTNQIRLNTDGTVQMASGVLSTDKGTRLSTSGAQPTCDATTRGLLWNIEGGAGVADILQICQKDAGDAYVWVTK